MNSPCSILNLLPHAGGGMGVVLRALLTTESKPGNAFMHSVAALEYLNDATRTHLNSHGIPWSDCLAMGDSQERLSALVEAADIVLLHWWNHPLLMRLLFNGIPPSRLMIWSHVNGFYPPQSFFPELFELPDRFVFATKASLHAPVVKSLPDELKQRMRVIRSCAGIPKGAENSSVKAGPFQVGYVGTVEPAKMHPDFLEICVAAGIPAPCIVAGGPAHEELRTKAKRLGLAGNFDILGPVDDTRPIFSRLHAFAYPLNPTHYGTGEQVLIEAMAFGAVPVVLANLPEITIVRHGETGLVAKNAEEFSAALRLLMENPLEREKLAAGGHSFVIEECGIEHSIKGFHVLFNEILRLPKRPRRLHLPSVEGVKDGSPFHLFLVSCGNTPERSFFEKEAPISGLESLPQGFTSKSRGTPFHYLRMLGHDPKLESICNTYYGETEATP